jgi:hypothetical protein
MNFEKMIFNLVKKSYSVAEQFVGQIGYSQRKTKLYNELLSMDIPTKDIDKVLISFKRGADTEHSISKGTGIDAWTVKTILDKAEKYRII